MSALVGTIQLRRDTAANWTSNNPTLLAGEVGLETDTRKGKIGDGTTAWASLPYTWALASHTHTASEISNASSNGQSLITAADYAEMRTLLGLWTTVSRTTDATAKTSNTTLSADDTLKFAMGANKKYQVRARIFYITGGTPDFKWRHSGPASPTRIALSRRTIAPGATSNSNIALDTAYSSADVAVDGAAGTGCVYIDGIVENGANAGDFEFHWAQNTSNGTGTYTIAGSYIEYREVA